MALENGLVSHLTDAYFSPGYRPTSRLFEQQARPSVLKLQLAMRRYELKHGQLPEKLEVLVPDFIEAIPLDPLDGKPLRWNPETQRLYTIGHDLTDDGGNFRSDWDLSGLSSDRGADYLWKPKVQPEKKQNSRRKAR